MFFIPLFYSLLLIFQIQKQVIFEPQVIDSDISIGYGLAIGDVDGDGKPDILLADKNEFVWYRNGDWKKFVMIENLTESDNVCIAARDLDGDGKVEVAVGAQWNPGETSDTQKSGAVHYLIRPEDPTQKWTSTPLHHEPTTHRMRWLTTGESSYLIVVPLHGRGNVNGEGNGVKVIAYKFPGTSSGRWTHEVIDDQMHLTHNLDIVNDQTGEHILLGGKEGVKSLSYSQGEWHSKNIALPDHHGVGELRLSNSGGGKQVLATVEPMHGTTLVAYEGAGSLASANLKRHVLYGRLTDGHALVSQDLLGIGTPQIAVGWRVPNDDGEFGIKLFTPKKGSFSEYEEQWIDQNGMACEDLQAADLDGDGKPDLIAAGRSTKNLKIYWNKSR